MRYTYEQMKSMLQGAYKKLKSYYFYDKTLVFIKKKIAEFESDDGCFQQTFDVLAKALISENSAYFEELIDQLDYRVFPKRLVAASAPTSTIVGTIDHHKNIAKVNFFIDVPIELLILDCLWTLCIAKISNKKYGTQACSYAGKFKASVFYFNQDDLYEGIDWESNRCFEPYYENYSRWQKDAFSKLRQGLQVQNQLMLSLDLKSFYYSVRFEFDSLSALLSDDSRLSEISFISHVEEKLYLSYTKLISKYKKGINIKNNATIFPIGLLSPILLRELYLYAFDQRIKFALNPTHYGRYVDDMIIIIPAEVQANNVTQNYVCNLLKEKGLIRKKISIQNEDFTFVGFESIAIQREKINCFFFEQNASNVLIEVAEKQIRDNSSEANLLPEFDVIKNHFNDIAYFFNTNYFSSIVESTSRDLHCLIVQANTSKYGDSRITGPYDTIHKNVVQIKGGINDVVIIGELEFEQIRNARQLYEENHKKTQLHCFACKRVKNAKYPDFFKACNNCPHQAKKQAIKDVPANFE